MGQQFEIMSTEHCEFIARQHVFFVATACDTGRVNVSPKGLDALRVLSPARVIWLNLTGSGNETSVHVQRDGRMTIMFCAFEGKPLILRLYGQARVIHPADKDWPALLEHFPVLPGARQIFDLAIERVQSSCGMAVPLLEFQENRSQLTDWAARLGEAGVEAYWRQKNQTSLDGWPTRICE